MDLEFKILLSFKWITLASDFFRKAAGVIIFAVFILITNNILAVSDIWTDTYNGAANMADVGNSVAVSTVTGNVYVVGYTSAGLNGNDVWIRKYNSSGIMQWTTAYHSAAGNDDNGAGIAVDAYDNIYVIGSEDRDDIGQNWNIWIAKYDTDGILQWTTTHNGSDNLDDRGYGIAVDPGGYIYAIGSEYVSGQWENVWVTKYNNSGLIEWTTTYNEAGMSDIGYAIDVDTNGNVYVAGSIKPGGDTDVWVRKYDNSGLVQWTTSYNGLAGGENDVGQGIAVDPAGNVYVTGRVRENLSWFDDIWTCKYDTNGLTQWTTSYNNPNNSTDYGYGIAADINGNAYVTGYENTAGEGPNIWIRKYDTSGLTQWTTTYNSGGTNSDFGRGITVDGSGNVYVTGSVNISGQGDNIWVRKYTEDADPPAGISDLTALTGDNEGEIKLEWTSPGDDDITGTLTGKFQIKFSSIGIITNTNYDTPPIPTYFIDIPTSSVTPLTACTTTLYNLQPGTSFWFAIKTQDDADNWSVWNSSVDNTSVNVDAFAMARGDVILPTIVNNESGGDNVVRTSPGTTYNVSFYDDGGLDRIEYKANTEPAEGGSVVISWSDIAVLGGTTYYTTPWEIHFSSFISLPATNYISVRAKDLAGNTTTLIDAFYVLIDSETPASVVESPSNSSNVYSLPFISGTASDNNIVDGVKLQIQRLSDNQYWTGGTWGAPTWLDASANDGTFNQDWETWIYYGLTDSDLTTGTSYWVVSLASDTVANVESSMIGISTFTYRLKRSISSGNWNNTATWFGGEIPLEGDAVYIESPWMVTLNADTSDLYSLTVEDGASLDNDPPYTINITSGDGGGFYNYGTLENIAGTLCLQENKVVLSTSTTEPLCGSFMVQSGGTTTLNSNIIVRYVQIDNGGALDPNDNVITVSSYGWVQNGSFICGVAVSSVVFAADQDQTISGSASPITFANFVIDSSSNVIASGPLDINGNFNIVNGTFVAGNYEHFISSDFDQAGGGFEATGSTITFDGDTDVTVTLQPGSSFYCVKINKSGGTLYADTDIDINGNFTIDASTYQPLGYTHRLGGSFILQNSGMWGSGSGTFIFDGDGTPQYIPSGGNWNRFEVEPAAYVGCATALSARFMDDFVLHEGAVFDATNGNPTFTGGTLSSSGTFVTTNSTVTFDGSVTISAGIDFNGLKLGEFSSGHTVIVSTEITAAGLTISSNTLDMQSSSITVSGPTLIIGTDAELDINTSTTTLLGGVAIMNGGAINMSNTSSVQQSKLVLGDSSSLYIDAAGFFTSASTNNIITSPNPGSSFYSFIVNNGTVSVTGLTLESADNNGLVVNGLEDSITNVSFRSLQSGATAFNILFTLVQGTYTFAGDFDSSVSSNIAAPNLTDGIITVSTATGAKAGPDYENDPNDRIFWDGIDSIASIVQPDGGETFTVGDSTEIIWNTSGSIKNVVLEYSNDDFTSNVYHIATISTSSVFGTYTWTIPDVSSETVKVRVSAANKPDIYAVSGGTFTVLPVPITGIADLYAAIDVYPCAVKLTWTYPEALSAGSSYYIEYSTDSNNAWSINSAQVVKSTSVTGGQQAAVSVGGLDTGRDGGGSIISPDYYFRVWVSTGPGAYSTLSNSASYFANTPAVGTDTGPTAQEDGGWITTYNNISNGPDVGYSIAKDDSGNVYIAGYYYNGSNNDMIIRKYNSAGVVQWTRYYNSPMNAGDDRIYGIAVDTNNNVYVSGFEERTDLNQGTDIWVAKYDTNGLRQWTTSYHSSGTNSDESRDIDVDNNGNSYITGYETSSGQKDISISKYDTNGLLVWTTIYNGAYEGDDDIGENVAVDGDGNVYITGLIGTSGNLDVFVAKYDTNGLPQWTTTYNSPANNDDQGNSIEVDNNGDVFVSAYELRTDISQSINIWVRKYNSAGLVQWTTTYNSPANSDDWGQGVDVDDNGDVYVTGTETRSDLVQGNNIWMSKYDGVTGLLQWTTSYSSPGNSDDSGYDIIVDDSGNVYISGFETISGENTNLWLCKYIQSYLEEISFYSYTITNDQIGFGWHDCNYESSYTFHTADGFTKAVLDANTDSYIVTDIGVNASTSVYVTAYNTWGSTSTAVKTRYTSANTSSGTYVLDRTSYSVTVDWYANGNPGYTRYEVIRSTEEFLTSTTTLKEFGDNYTSTIFVDTISIVNETNYWYKIQAYNEDGIESGYDVMVVTQTLPALPTAPSNLTAALLGQTSIQWQFDDNNILEEELYISSGDYTRISGNIGPLSGTGTTYWWEVNIGTNTLCTRYAEAANACGSVYSNSISSYTLAAVPASFTVNAYSPDSIELIWSANDNPDNTRYGITQSTDPTFVTSIDVIAYWNTALTANTTMVHNLNPGTTYYFRLLAYNGDQYPSAYVEGSTVTSSAPLEPPAQISDLTGLAGSLDGEVVLSWTSPGDDGTTYNISGGEFKLKLSTNAIGNETEFTSATYEITSATDTVPLQPYSTVITGLNPGTFYYFALKYKDGANNWASWSTGTYTNTASTATAQDLEPNAVTDLTAAGADTQITLTWTIPDPPDDINDYEKFFIYRATCSFIESEKNNSYVTILDTYTYQVMASTTYLDSGLTNNVTYYYNISLLDTGDQGNGLYSVALESFSVVQVSTCAWEPLPGTPTGFSGTALSTGSIQWSWADVTGEDGYFVLYSTDPQGSPASFGIAADILTWTETGLSANTSYYRLVVATNTSGESGLSDAATTYTLAAAPLAPVTFLSVGYSSVTFQWVSNPDNPAWTRYGVMVSTDSNFAINVSTTVTFSDDHTTASTTTVSLTPEMTYYFRVIAFNEDQIQTAYIQDSTMTMVGPPAAPSDLKISVLLGQTSIYWQVEDNSTNESELYISSGADTSMRLSGNLANTVFTGTTYWTETGLTPNTTYTRYAEVLNVVDSIWSVSITSATAAAAPANSTLLSRTSYSAEFDWDPNGNPEPGTEYLVSYATSSDFGNETSEIASTTTHTLSSLNPSTTYYFRIRARNLDQVVNQEYDAILSTDTLPAPATQLQVVAPGETNIGGTGISGAPDTQTAGVAFTITVNAINANFHVDITTQTSAYVTTSDAYDTEPSTRTLINGTTIFEITPIVSTNTTITAVTTGGLSSGISSYIPVGPGTATRLLILVPGETLEPGSASGKTGTPSAQSSYTTFSITVNACDIYWNVDTSATPLVSVLTDDTADVNPSNLSLINGTTMFNITLVTVGTSSMSVYDLPPSLESYTSSYVTVLTESTPPYAVVDSSNPTDSGYIMSLPVIFGTAYDNVAVSSVSISIQVLGGNYWDGSSGFNSVSQDWRYCGVFSSSWTYPAGGDSIPAWTDGTTYIIFSSAADTSDNWTTEITSRTFTYDVSLPSSTIIYPVNGSTYSTLETVSGTADDALSGVSDGGVQISFYDSTNSKYWNGSSWAGAGHYWIVAISTDSNIWTSTNVPTSWTSDTDYEVYSRAIDDVGNTEISYSTVTFRITSSLPTAPSGLTATEVTASSIKWIWTDNAANEENYYVRNSTDGLIAVLAADISTYQHINLSPNTAYSVYVEAYNAAGTSTSAVVTSYTLSNIPTSFVVTSKDYNFAALQWSVNSNPSGTLYELQRSTDNVTFTAVISSDTTSHKDENLEQLTTYYYRIYSVNGDSVKTGPAELTVTTLNSIVKGPISGSVTQSDGSTITGVRVELYSNDGTAKISEVYTDTEGKYEFTDIEDGLYRLVCSWLVDEMEAMVYLTDISENSNDVLFTLEIQYTLAELVGRITLGSRANMVGRFAPTQQPYVELIQRGRVIARIDSDTSGNYNIPNLLPGKYVMRAYNGVQMSEPAEVYVKEGEKLNVNFRWALALLSENVYAYPNPVQCHNGVTKVTIKYKTLNLNHSATIKIYNIAGELVREVADTEIQKNAVSSGGCKFEWNMKNEDNDGVASGVYIYILELTELSTGEEAMVKKKIAIIR
ncbi:MAG: SBBP repeat-containing protein [Elusimicrobia bacterium]|nr:SBBP repeat-containing protein [Elusimicrobiota bacterium]